MGQNEGILKAVQSNERISHKKIFNQRISSDRGSENINPKFNKYVSPADKENTRENKFIKRPIGGAGLSTENLSNFPKTILASHNISINNTKLNDDKENKHSFQQAQNPIYNYQVQEHIENI